MLGGRPEVGRLGWRHGRSVSLFRQNVHIAVVAGTQLVDLTVVVVKSTGSDEAT